MREVEYFDLEFQEKLTGRVIDISERELALNNDGEVVEISGGTLGEEYTVSYPANVEVKVIECS